MPMDIGLLDAWSCDEFQFLCRRCAFREDIYDAASALSRSVCFFLKFIPSDAMLAASSVCIPITMYDRPLLYGFDVPVNATRTL